MIDRLARFGAGGDPAARVLVNVVDGDGALAVRGDEGWAGSGVAPGTSG